MDSFSFASGMGRTEFLLDSRHGKRRVSVPRKSAQPGKAVRSLATACPAPRKALLYCIASFFSIPPFLGKVRAKRFSFSSGMSYGFHYVSPF
jgi:hypothetical protein